MGGYEPTNPWSRYTGVIYSNKPNTVGQVDRSALNQWHGIATKSNISGEVKLLPFLTFKSSIALDLVRNQSDSFRPSYYLDGDEYSTYAGASRSVANKDYWVFDNYLTYNQKFDKHAVTAMSVPPQRKSATRRSTPIKKDRSTTTRTSRSSTPVP